ncbi:MAG: EAL domain-containing protein [Halieaceae bacterium]
MDASAGQLRRSTKLFGLGLIGLGLLVSLQYSGLVWYSSRQLNEREITESINRVEVSLQRQREVLAAVVREYAWWTDTITWMIESQNLEWIAVNFGLAQYESYGISEVVALDADSRPVYAQRMAQPAPPEDLLGWEPSILRPLISTTQASPMDIAVPSVTITPKGEKLFVVTVSAISRSDSVESALIRQPRPSLLMATEIDQAALAAMAEDLSILDLQWSAVAGNYDASLPILDDQQKVQGYLSWNVEKPGAAVMSTVALWSMPSTLVSVMLALLLLRRFHGVIKESQAIQIKSAVVQQSQNYFQSMSDNAPVLIWQTDVHGRIVYGNRKFHEFWEQDGLGPTPHTMADINVAEGRGAWRGFIDGITQTGQSEEQEFQLRTETGDSSWLLIVGTPQRGDDQLFDCILFSASDITDRKGAETLAWHRANYDSLTELPNRNLLQDRLAQELAISQRTGLEVAVMFIDLDNFKKINDSLGHSAGDKVLQEAAHRISGCLRKRDTAARLGGDEFVVVLPEAGDAGDVRLIADRIRQELAREIPVEGLEVQVSASIGVAQYPHDGKDGEALMMHADTAMYRAKHNGRNNTAFYEADMNIALQHSIQMETNLRNAIRREELFLEYQPIFEPRRREPMGVEALCRWTLPGGDRVPPDQFIPLAERAGLMCELGDQLLVSACKQLQSWQQQGRAVYIALNLSPAQLVDAGFAGRVKELIETYAIDPAGLQFELTENVLLEDRREVRLILDSLANLGIQLAVDDFGTGYSSLSYLRRFPVHRLKIDRSFISEIPGSKRDQELVRAIIAMARSLQLVVVAEGVETEEQLAFLNSIECDLVQGYLLGRPVVADQLWQKFDRPALKLATDSGPA